MSNVQFLMAEDGTPAFAVLPYAEYLTLKQSLPGQQLPTQSLLSADGTRILLPNGGPGAYLDLFEFANYVNSRQIPHMAINQRAQALEKFPKEQLENTLDPLIRQSFLPKDSPYKNTMQATAAVVDALVESGLFIRVKQSYPYFFRPVNAIACQQEAIENFLNRPLQAATPTTA